MEETVSVSKGCFVYNSKSRKKKVSKKDKSRSNDIHEYSDSPWFGSYVKCWTPVDNEIKEIYSNAFSDQLDGVINSIKCSHADTKFNDVIPTIALLTGVSLSDHSHLFKTLCDTVRSEVTPYVTMLHAYECNNIRTTVENLVSQLVNFSYTDNQNVDDVSEDKPLKRSNCNFYVLSEWYQSVTKEPNRSVISKIKIYQDEQCDALSDLSDSPADNLTSSGTRKKKKSSTASGRTNCGDSKYSPSKPTENQAKPLLVFILPDFESFQPCVLQNLILIASQYSRAIPMVFVFGVATSVRSLHQTFPYHVSCKISIETVYFQSSTLLLEEFFNKVILSTGFPFLLDGTSLKILTDSFFNYNFSTYDIYQGFKFCMIEHFYKNSSSSLCCPVEKIEESVASLTKNDLEKLRNIPSLQVHAASRSVEEKLSLFNDDKYFVDTLVELLKQFHQYRFDFLMALKCLHTLVSDLPKSPLNCDLWKLYLLAVTSHIPSTSEYRSCFHLLTFLSQEEFLNTLNKILSILVQPKCNYDMHKWKTVHENLSLFAKKLQNASVINGTTVDNAITFNSGEKLNRHRLKEKLFEMAQKRKALSPYESVLKSLLNYLSEEVFSPTLQSPSSLPFHEIFLFTNSSLLKARIFPSPRAVVHMGLNNPKYYFSCTCCELPDNDPGAIVSSMPDVCIAYKLHLECGKQINMYDWLQAFLTIVNPDGKEEEEQRDISPQLQARFMRAVSDLQFLGFIKTSTKKTEHIIRLT